MRSATPVAESVDFSPRSAIASRIADYATLTKPRIVVMGLVAVAVGYTLGSAGEWLLLPLIHALAGVALIAGGCSALNQFLERDIDARMTRTANRPLPSGRLSKTEVLLFGLTTGALGTVYLLWFVNSLTALLAVATLLSYTLIYTPLKQRTSFCTAVGAVPGALPPVLGWTAACGALDWGAFALFAILYLWQFPHFLAIGWIYRDEYSQAGLKMLPASPTPRVVGFMAVGYALALLPVSLLPSQLAMSGTGYSLVAIVLGLGYIVYAVRFLLRETTDAARQLLWVSLVYLPLLLLALTWDHLQLLS